MNRTFSLYLDFVRFTAAVLVFLWHSRKVEMYESLWFRLGHESVLVFFVLSGFVIAFCREHKESTLTQYTVNRASRIYSVAIPTIFITIALDLACAKIAPETYGAFHDLPLVRVVSSLLFTNEAWFFSITSFSNVPYWSLNYEVWYYALFGIAAYVQRYRLALLLGICLLIGPKILLLAPCWWMGVWVYRSQRFAALGRGANLALYVATWAAFLAYINLGVAWLGFNALKDLLGTELWVQFTWSRHFLTDYSLAVIIGLHLGAARELLKPVTLAKEGWVGTASTALRTLAGTTFALYLLHQPMLNFFAEVYRPLGLQADLNWLVVAGSVLGLIIPFGFYLERTKGVYRTAFEWVAVQLHARVFGPVRGRLAAFKPAT